MITIFIVYQGKTISLPEPEYNSVSQKCTGKKHAIKGGVYFLAFLAIHFQSIEVHLVFDEVVIESPALRQLRVASQLEQMKHHHAFLSITAGALWTAHTRIILHAYCFFLFSNKNAWKLFCKENKIPVMPKRRANAHNIYFSGHSRKVETCFNKKKRFFSLPVWLKCRAQASKKFNEFCKV